MKEKPEIKDQGLFPIHLEQKTMEPSSVHLGKAVLAYTENLYQQGHHK